jgi:glycosyltransferase involved in cell wall biosynthesis
MRIGIDARFFGPFGKGLGRYTEELVRGVTSTDTENEYVVFLHPSNFSQFEPTRPDVRKVVAPFRWYSLAEQVRFPGLIRREAIDLMHFPHFNVPLVTHVPFLVTIHDLILSRFPTERATTLGPVLYALKHRAYQFVISRAVQRACRVLSVSETTKQEVIEEFHLNPDRVAVTLLGVDHERWQQRAGEEKLKQWGITQPYFLFVGNAYPHKNLERMLRAFQRLRQSGRQWQLVIVGRDDYFFLRLREEAERLGLVQDRAVVFPGYVTDAELARLYHDCLAYVFPSLAEGFGLPPLEAMAAGAVVASSSASSLPEVLGGAALYFDPKSVPDMTAVMERIGTDELLRQELRTRAQEHVLRYDWRTMVQETITAYRSCLVR